MKKKVLLFVIAAVLQLGLKAQFSSPTIITQPEDQTGLCPYQWAQFVISALNADSYQWQVSQDSGNVWSNINDDFITYLGATNDTLQVFASQNVNGFLYRCIVYASSGDSVISDSAILMLETVPPTIQSHPADVYIGMFGTANIMFGDVAVATDNCGVIDSTVTPGQLDCSYVGDTVQVVVSATDISGNTAYDTTYVVVHDTTPPTAIPNVSGFAYINDTGAAYVDQSTLLLSASDNCGIADTIIYPDYFTCSDVGTTPNVNIVLIDEYGNADTTTVPVMVMDTIAPTIQCMGDTVINLPPGDTVYTVPDISFDPAVSDNCGINQTFNTYTMTGTLYGAQFPVGSTQVVWTTMDNSGTSATCSYTITVNAVTNMQLLETGINIYPNPVHGILNVEDKENKILSIDLMDINGRVLKIKKIKSEGAYKFDTSQLTKGVYLLKVNTVDGTFVKKVNVK